jgi:hypothetical protein
MSDQDYDVSRLKDWLTRPGCLVWILSLLLLGGIVVVIFFITDDSGPSEPDPAGAGSPSPAASATSAPPAAGCEDVTAAFRETGGPDVVRRVCWEPTGQLRAEADLPADIEPRSAPMRAACTALSEFVAASGRDWKGFTVYSTHRFSPGQAMLASSEAGRCARPSR